MMYRVREQSELKHSGVEWLGNIPSGWEVSRLKYIFKSMISGGTPNSSNYENYTDFEKGIPFITITDMSKSDFIYKTKKSLTSKGIEEKNLTILDEGTLLYSIFATIGKVSELKIKAVTNQALLGLLLKNEKQKQFSKYYLKFLENYVLSTSTSNTQNNINLDKFKNFPFVENNEQQKIANFLDEKSKIFDDALSKKEFLIKKLEDAKKSLISEIVTGKLKVVEQNGKLKTVKREKTELETSGIEWLGNVPKSWQVKKSKYLFKIQKRIAGKLGFNILSITQTGIKVKDTTTGGGQLSMDYSKYQIVNIGDFAMNHMDLLTGYVDIAKSKGVTSPDYRVFTLTDKNSVSSYFLYLFQMGYKNQIFYAFGQGSSQLGRWRLPAEEFKKFYFPSPSKDEQKLISNYLDEKLIYFDKTINKTKQSIIKLKLAKESLISQAVTGKIEIL